ncbi:hypothetical protein G7Y89_g11431 [Cudoniella acicularis]|uniref:non-specific serine/threonine protein kinase n=1 Tax=Cudoniella acicularis TaxID=354080 RepID=A0A8H4VY12_9HELO|nr:hypothetical protein G7Y89_g11431 [Cudoniella acicularis]
MAPNVSDLIIDSKLEVESFDNYTIQTRLISNPAIRQRPTRERERWQRTKKLGNGSYGVVWLEKCTTGPSLGEVRAVKAFDKEIANMSIKYQRELEAIAKFSQEKYRDYFVRSFGWYENENTVFITMEYLELGDLEGYLKTRLGVKTRLSNAEARQIAQQLLEGLVFMHDNNFVHRDLKPANVLVLHQGPEWWVKIADFGITKRIDGTELRTVIGTEAYLAPEVRGIYTTDSQEDDKHTFSFAVDIWAVGAITFRMITSQLAFPPGRKLFDYVVGGQPFPVEQSMSSECNDFVIKTMAASPRYRPTSQQALSYPWILTQEPISNDSDLPSMTRIDFHVGFCTMEYFQ